MPEDRSKRTLLLCAALALAAGVLSAMQLGLRLHGSLTLIYLAIFFIWLQSIRTRFLQRDMRRTLTNAAYLMILLLLLRLVKYEFSVSESGFARALWYLYYVPMLLVPLQFFLAALYVGKPDGFEISKHWRLLYIPYAVIILCILTNDLHQLAFRFRPGFLRWGEDYSYGPFYYAAAAAMSFSLLGILTVVFGTCARRQFVSQLWKPLAVLLIGAVYVYAYSAARFHEKWIFQRMYELPEFICLFLMMFWESLVFSHMIPSNMRHETFFRDGSIRAGLADNRYAVALKSAAGVTPTEAALRSAEHAPLLLDGDTLLKCQPVHGGHFYWTEDVSELNRLNQELEDTGDYLVEEHAMLDAAAKLEEGRRRTAEQNRLYDEIAHSLRPQLDALDARLSALPEDETVFRETMRYAGVLGAYIKRRSNLLLLSGTEPYIMSEELSISIAESLEYVHLADVPCHAELEPGLRLPGGLALELYALFEAALEAALPDADAVLVTLSAAENDLTFYMEFSSPTAQLADAARGRAQVETSDGCECITFRTKLGGDAV